VYCHAARWLTHDLPRASTLEVSVRGGFYVRSLARDLGRALGCGAHLAQLARTTVGPWSVPRPGEPVQLTGADVLPWLPSLELTDDEWGRVRRGAALPTRAPHPPTWPMPLGFPGAPWLRALRNGRLVAVQGDAAPVLLPGGV